MNVLVLPAVLQDVPHHAVQHRNIGAGPQPDIFGGMRRGARQARIDDDEIRPIELGAFEDMLQRHRMRFRRIAAPDHDGLGVADVVEAVGHRAVAPGIGDAGDRGRMADAGLMIGVVGAPEGAELAEQIGAFVGHLGGAEQIDQIRPGLLRGYPASCRRSRRSPGPRRCRVHWPLDKLHRIFQAAFAADQFAHRRALGAMRAAIDRAVPGRLLADPDIVGDFGQHGAADRAMGADGLARRDLRAGGRRRSGLGLAHGAKRQRAERGKAQAATPERRRKARRSSAAVARSGSAPAPEPRRA